MATNTERNKQVIREFYDLAFNQRQPEEAAKRYIGLAEGDLGVLHSQRAMIP